MNPTAIPFGIECTRRAYQPAATPTRMPLMVEKKTIARICARTAGVNHAVSPSTAPSSAPTSRPRRILFIGYPSSNVIQRRFDFSLEPHPEKDDRAHEDVGRDDRDQRP